MDKKTQGELSRWLKQQSKLAKRWLTLTVVAGVASAVVLIIQASLIAQILHSLIIEHADKYDLVPHFIGLGATVILRSALAWGREIAGYRSGEQVRIYIRGLVVDKMRRLGPGHIKGKTAGAWGTMLIEQVEEMQDFFAKYLPQMALSALIPFMILVVVFPLNWVSGLIFLITAPLIPFFMALVGKKAADANRKNFKALQRLSGHFYDRLQAMTTIRLFDRARDEKEQLHAASEVFRERTMSVLKIAFLSSAVLEFFTSISIALTAVYFGFTFIGELNFGHYGTSVTLFTGLFILILAPEFYQPLRDLGTFYHAKQQAIGAAESIVDFLNIEEPKQESNKQVINSNENCVITASDLIVTSTEGKVLVGPVSFTLETGKKTALVGPSGAGKTSIMNALLGFLPYQGSLTINGTELSEVDLNSYRSIVSWVGQNPLLVHGTIAENLNLAEKTFSTQELQDKIKQAHADEFIDKLGLDHAIADRSGGLSVGQAQRIALARALLQDGQFWLLDEPTASLDARSESLINESLQSALVNKTALMVTHQLSNLQQMDQILVLENGALTQQGSYSELEHQGTFKAMLNQQQALGGDIDA
ncbi:heme ABC transporter permease/ATP-binding protein CydD [Vibrio breoganii]|uniref:Cysteine/glutathione ABC transporter permease/ATP-binding protein CydD n=1 Tax=Vibrio breoganii TaxID=553239 RepID=A0ABX1U3B3_9VIBR|nr:cysteine/glutathione ABC transporter permease/ATP-binding protein CydD [Vibrio breoganii]NMO72440.1 cysteine/glutathione ABC transporter permease/ATP-binding protein CydD [Vibrio breoganii]NMR68968.1 cysteine/glutathione ABC transporter permease/ATP-binding protein CydD [Vibrio breoganii]PMG03428.1 thiol reductant ABC exporter subunit CydD [Vibrio breoganii]PML84254.1 thiol reductant ABC exporter subunit CydD [Vibrio breoganii]PMP06859.1 thiol reductant ABC exporter subunit CydD [Vibrio bre